MDDGVLGHGQEVAKLRAECDVARRHLMDKKAQLVQLEQQCARFDGVAILLTHLVRDLQATGQITFVEPDKLECPFPDALAAVPVVLGGVRDLIGRHDRLAKRFELEFNRTLFDLEQRIAELDSQCAREEDRLKCAQRERHHVEGLIRWLSQEKLFLMRTVLARRGQLAGRLAADQTAVGRVRTYLDDVNKYYAAMQNRSSELDAQSDALTADQAERKREEARQLERHRELLETVAALTIGLQRENHAHNCSLSALDSAKAELKQLMMVIESYHDNLKTQELLDAEHENRKLHAVINNDKTSLSRAREAVARRGRESEAQIAALSQRISNLNQQIVQTEQKIQTQMLRIPDFAQLRQALDRLLAQYKKQREEVLQRLYQLDEIRDRNRMMDMIEIQESLNRQAQLRQLMPLANEEAEESRLPTMLEICRRQQAEIEDLLLEPGFWDRAIGARP
jgi:hypothetical protein